MTGDIHQQFTVAELHALAAMDENEWEDVVGPYTGLGIRLTMLPDWDAEDRLAVYQHGEALFKALETSGPGHRLTALSLHLGNIMFSRWAEMVTGVRFRVRRGPRDGPDWPSVVERLPDG